MTYATITATQEILEKSQEKYQPHSVIATAVSEKVNEGKKAN